MPRTTVASTKKDGRASGGVRAYLHGSRDLFTSLILVLPLFALYQVGILATGGVRNGVDFVTDLLMYALNGSLTAYLVFNLFVLVGSGFAIAAMRKRGSFHAKLVPWMLMESAVYALFFGSTISLMIHSLGLDALLAAGGQGGYNPLTAMVMSIGAGLYEETVFRLFLMGGMYWVLTKVLRQGEWASAIVALVASSAIFSLVHHLGPLGEAFTMGAFVYRFFAGVLLAAIFQWRGFAIAVYTHAFYDVYVMVILGR